MSPFRIVFIFLIMSFLGLISSRYLSVSLLPDDKDTSLQVSYQLPGAAPDLVENLATAPLEGALAQIDGIKGIRSVSRYDGGEITLDFEKKTDIEIKKFEIAMHLRRLYPKLPEGLSYPVIRTAGRPPQTEAALVYAIHGPTSGTDIEVWFREATKLHFFAIPDIESIQIHGADQKVIEITYDPDQMNDYGITHQQLRQHIGEAFRLTHMGQVRNREGGYTWLQRLPIPSKKEKIDKIIISKKPILYFADLASWQLSHEMPSRYYRVNGEPAVTLSFQLRKGSNVIVATEAIKAAMKTLPLPEQFTQHLEWDQSVFLNQELRKTYHRALLSLLILSVFIIAWQRNIKHLFVLIISLLVNLSLTILALYLLAIPVHLYTLAGVAISFGLILDNALVTFDGLHYRRTGSVFLSLVAASLTTISALSLVFLLPEDLQVNLRDFASVVSLSLAISLPIALFFTPAIYRLLIVSENNKAPVLFSQSNRRSLRIFKKYTLLILFLSRHRKKTLLIWLLLFGMPVFWLPSGLPNNSWYMATIGSDFYQQQLRPYIDRYLGGSLRLFVRYGYERFAYRSPERMKLYVEAEMPDGTTAQQMNDLFKHIEYMLKNELNKGYIEKFLTEASARQGRVVILFTDSVAKTNYPFTLKNQLVRLAVGLDGASWNIYGVGPRGFSNSNAPNLASFRVEMRGPNYQELEQEAQKLAYRLAAHKRVPMVKTNERLTYQERERISLASHLDMQALADQNLSLTDWQTAWHLQRPSSGTDLYLPYQGQRLPAKLVSKNAQQLSLQDLKSGSFTIQGKSVAWKDFLHLHPEKSTSAIHKENRLYIRVLGFDYYGNRSFGEKFLASTLEAYQTQLPPAYQVKELRPDFFPWQKASKPYALLGVLVVMIFFICSILFESLRQAFVILLVIPTAFIGVFLTFGGLEVYFDQGGYAAFVLLGGLVVNAAIFVMDTFNHFKHCHKSKHPDHILFFKAIYAKSYPILLTTFSTFLGLLPFLWNEEPFWFSLAAGVTGGLLFSLLAVFVVLPVLMVQRTR
ncbi:MAG: efflux RND transporter permease subunit [Bernardetiaceae bacterium]